MSDLELPILVGGGAFAAYLWSRSRDRKLPDVPPIEPADVAAPAPSTPPAPKPPAPPPFNRPIPGRWIWPVPSWRGRRPVVSDGFGSPRPGGQRHEGVDLMYARLAGDPWRSGSPNGAAHHVMPDDTLALAASDGVIWSAGWVPRGFSIVIDHTPLAPVATYYTHLTKLLVATTQRGASRQRVSAGEPIGIIGADPLDGTHLKHLHFALWRGGPRDAVDPEPVMRGWEYVADPHEPSPGAAVALRNAALVYRPVGARGDPYPEWVRDLRGKSGVYVIRKRDRDGDPVTVYVGESHTGNLPETLTRHFQQWRRWKGYWRDQYGEGHDPGLTYERASVEVAVRVTSANDALDEEARLIHRLKPRDNLKGQPIEGEAVPF